MEKNSTANYALRLPRSLKVEVERLAAEDGISVNSDLAAFSISRGWQRFEDNFPTELCSDVSIDSDETQQLEPQD